MILTSKAKIANSRLRYWRDRLMLGTYRPTSESLFVNFNTIALQIRQWQDVLWSEVMAKRQADIVKVEFKGFANLEVPEEAKEDVKRYLKENKLCLEYIETLILDGHKVSVGVNEKNGAIQATAFCTYSKSPNAGFILSAFAGNWYDAVAVLAWKHVVLSGRGKWHDDLQDSELPEFG